MTSCLTVEQAAYIAAHYTPTPLTWEMRMVGKWIASSVPLVWRLPGRFFWRVVIQPSPLSEIGSALTLMSVGVLMWLFDWQAFYQLRSFSFSVVPKEWWKVALVGLGLIQATAVFLEHHAARAACCFLSSVLFGFLFMVFLMAGPNPRFITGACFSQLVVALIAFVALEKENHNGQRGA